MSLERIQPGYFTYLCILKAGITWSNPILVGVLLSFFVVCFCCPPFLSLVLLKFKLNRPFKMCVCFFFGDNKSIWRNCYIIPKNLNFRPLKSLNHHFWGNTSAFWSLAIILCPSEHLAPERARHWTRAERAWWNPQRNASGLPTLIHEFPRKFPPGFKSGNSDQGSWIFLLEKKRWVECLYTYYLFINNWRLGGKELF